MKRLLNAISAKQRIGLLVIAALLCIFLLLTLREGREPVALNEDEQRMQRILSRIEGVGAVSVMLAQDEKGMNTGAVIAAQGADDLRIQLELQRAVRALTGLELDRIEIVKSGDGGRYA